MTIDSRYPKNWKEISKRVREESDNKCQHCGIVHGTMIQRKNGDRGTWRLAEGEKNAEWGKPTKARIDIHHMGVDYPDGRKGDKRDKADCRRENLIALCPRCHLRFENKEYFEARDKGREYFNWWMNMQMDNYQFGGLTPDEYYTQHVLPHLYDQYNDTEF